MYQLHLGSQPGRHYSIAVQTNATVEDVLRLASQGDRYEIVDGELVEMAPTGLGYGNVK